MLENRDKESGSPWQLECMVGAMRAVLTATAALCAGCLSGRMKGGGARKHAGSPVGGRLTEARQDCCSG